MHSTISVTRLCFTKPTQVSPPYLHIMLVSLRHITCCCSRTVTLLIKKLAWHWPKIYRDFEDSSPLGCYVNQLKWIENDEQLKQEYESQLVFVKEFTTDVLVKKAEVEEKLDDLYDSTDEKTKQLQELPQLRGPIAASLDNTLKKNITIQAHHGGSFKGNQCNEYIQQTTTENICQSVVRKTYEVTDNHNLRNSRWHRRTALKFSLCTSTQAPISNTAHHRLRNQPGRGPHHKLCETSETSSRIPKSQLNTLQAHYWFSVCLQDQFGTLWWTRRRRNM